jgi:hypothetical protein
MEDRTHKIFMTVMLSAMGLVIAGLIVWMVIFTISTERLTENTKEQSKQYVRSHNLTALDYSCYDKSCTVLIKERDKSRKMTCQEFSEGFDCTMTEAK